MNRGITLQEQGTSKELRAALESFDEAIAVFRNPVVRESAEVRLVLASALANRGNALLRVESSSAVAARESAEQALALTTGDEERDLLAAETGLKARHILCRAVAAQLSDRTGTIASEDLVAAATDAVDDGMKLARLWEARGERRFRDLARDLFRFGARAYQMHQSHFLTEFLLDNLDPCHSTDAFPVDPGMHAAANEAIAEAFSELQHDGFRSLNTPHFDRFLKTLRGLLCTQTRLGELRLAAACE
jgi:hypothetical protein